LTANLLLRPSSQPPRDPRRVARRRVRGLCPERPRERHGAVLAGPRSTAPPRHASRCTVFSTVRRACDAASDAVCRGPSSTRPESRVPVTTDRQTRLSPPSRQRRRLSPDQGAFHRTSAPSPGRTPCFRAACVGSRGARHRCRCSRARGSRHCDPASGAFSPRELPCAHRARPQGARPMAFRLDRAPLVDFCNQNSPRAHPTTA